MVSCIFASAQLSMKLSVSLIEVCLIPPAMNVFVVSLDRSVLPALELNNSFITCTEPTHYCLP